MYGTKVGWLFFTDNIFLQNLVCNDSISCALCVPHISEEKWSTGKSKYQITDICFLLWTHNVEILNKDYKVILKWF